MALELIKTGKLSIKNKGISLTQDSTQEQLKRALEIEPSLSSYIKENKSIRKDEKTDKKLTEKT